MKIQFLSLIVSMLLLVSSCTSQDKKIQMRYAELVAEYMAEEDRLCRLAALEEAKLSWSIETNDGEESSNSEPRLSKPGQ